MRFELSALLVPAILLAFSCRETASEAEHAATDAGGTDATSDGTAEDVLSGSELVGRAFDVVVSAKNANDGACFGGCEPVTLHVASAAGSTLTLIWGFPGRAVTAELEQVGPRWALKAPVQLDSLPVGWNMCASHTELTEAELDFADHDGDGAVDVTGSGKRVRTACSDDTGPSVTSTAITIAGKPDVTPPTASVWSAGGLSDLWVAISEPLRPTASASIGLFGKPVALSPALESGFVVSFTTNVILPFGAKLPISVVGEDLGAVGSPAPLVLSTPEDFGVLQQDGFESGSTEGISGAQIVSGFEGEAAIAGQKMLYVPPGAAALVRLQRAGGETEVAMKTRLVSFCYSFAGSAVLTAGVVGGTQRQSVSLANLDPSPLPADAGANAIGKPEPVSIALPDAGQDVLVAVWGDNYVGSGCAKVGILIDDMVLL